MREGWREKVEGKREKCYSQFLLRRNIVTFTTLRSQEHIEDQSKNENTQTKGNLESRGTNRRRDRGKTRGMNRRTTRGTTRGTGIGAGRGTNKGTNRGKVRGTNRGRDGGTMRKSK